MTVTDAILESMSTQELLQLHNAIITELRKRNVVRTQNKPLGDYAEWLVAKILDMQLANNSTAGYDVISSSGIRYQVKARQKTRENGSTQLSAIRNLEAKDFDYLIAILFDANYKVTKAICIPHSAIFQHAKFQKHTNSHLLMLKPSLFADSQVVDITERFQTEIK